MTDIVQRLRDAAEVGKRMILCSEAAAEIERLRSSHDTLDVMAEVGFNGYIKKGDRITELQLALALALTWLEKNEPKDSRGVSDGFVAMAAIAAGDGDSKWRAIVARALAGEMASRAEEQRNE